MSAVPNVVRIICDLIDQDFIADWFVRRKKARKNRYHYPIRNHATSNARSLFGARRPRRQRIWGYGPTRTLP
jgi:hypothetical protein